jgi:hypothetical protein
VCYDYIVFEHSELLVTYKSPAPCLHESFPHSIAFSLHCTFSQKGQGLPQAIHAHISAGIEEARKDPESLLIFSGGETRAVSGPQTESQAYYHVADAMSLWPSDEGASVRARTTTEEFATDSFENLYVSV